MRFSFKQLQYFVATGEEASIRAAATKIGVSEPSISTAIAHLESEFNVQLFVRHHAQGVSLTPAGRLLLTETRDVLDRAEALYTAADELANTITGKISVGSLVTLAPMILPVLAQTFTSDNAQTRVVTSEDNQDGLIAALRNADIDVALTYDMQLPDDIEFTSLADLPAHVIVGASHRLAKRKNVKLTELATDPYVLLDLPTSREYFFSLFRQAGVKPMIASRSQSQDVVWATVANSNAYSLRNVRPRTNCALDGQPIISIPLAGDHAPLHLGIAVLAGIRKRTLVETFQRFCCARITNSNIPGMTEIGSRK